MSWIENRRLWFFSFTAFFKYFIQSRIDSSHNTSLINCILTNWLIDCIIMISSKFSSSDAVARDASWLVFEKPDTLLPEMLQLVFEMLSRKARIAKDDNRSDERAWGQQMLDAFKICDYMQFTCLDERKRWNRLWEWFRTILWVV